jgi:hypothetical protein
LEVELLEARNLLATSTFGLTALVKVSDPSPLAPPASSSPTVFPDSEVEPQLAVDPTNPAHAVAIWQQDRFRSVGGARALVVSVKNANDPNASWSPPVAIPGFNSTDPLGAGFARYTDPWVTITPTGVVYATALALTPGGPFPSHTAVLVVKSIDGGYTWSAPTTLEEDQASAGNNPVNHANDKEMIIADPNDPLGQTAYVVWDQLDFPSDQASLDSIHAGAAIRENAFFSKTTDGGKDWTPAQNITNFQNLNSAFGNQLIVEPNSSSIAPFPILVDVCVLFNGSGNQPAHAGQTTVAVIRSIDGGKTWSDPITGPAVEAMPVTDPDTGKPVRDGEPVFGVTVDPNNGNLYAVWADGRFSNFTHDDIAFSMSTNGGKTWSDPIKVNHTPTNIPAGDQQAFTPSVAVNSDGTVAVTYYDFRNNDASSGLLTDYWLVHASSNFTTPSSWTADEKQLTDSSFDMEKAAPTTRGYFLGDYESLQAAGKSFYALFAQAGSSTSDPSNIWFRDPPPEPALAAESPMLAVKAQPVVFTPGDDTLFTSRSVPTAFVLGSTGDDSTASGLAFGLVARGCDSANILSSPVGENRTGAPGTNGLGSAAMDCVFAAVADDGNDSPLGLSNSTGVVWDMDIDRITDDCSLGTACSDSGTDS